MKKLLGRMAPPAEGKKTSDKTTGTTVAAPSTLLTCRTTTRSPGSGKKYGASTETSSAQCNVSETDRHVGVLH